MLKRFTHGTSLLALLMSLPIFAEEAPSNWGLNMPEGVTAVSQEVYDLHMLIFWICCAIGVVVFGAMIYSIIHHRKSKGAKAAQFHHNTTVEIIWTVIPIVILLAMAFPATKTLIKIEDTTKADITIKATGYQWNWGYEYLSNPKPVLTEEQKKEISEGTKKEDDYDLRLFKENFSFRSYLDENSNAARQRNSGIDPSTVANYLLDVDEPIVVPVNKKVQLLLTGADVIHAWWVPDLGGKKDAIPGFVNEMWFKAEKEGVYRGQCAELCGKDHGFMPIVVKVVSDEEFSAWAKDKIVTQEPEDRDYSMDELMAAGESAYNKVCASCHQINGQGMPGAFPALTAGSKATGPVDEHIRIILEGQEGTSMASFATLNDFEIAAITTYERNAWGNDTGDLVQPADIRDARAK